ncbi:NAD(P)/FAD-dependent oxidoreductase [Rubellimicrobium rubrum]|uniref:NAD(P)/FAD-dependent oxidoreductase n=1 Tax=Rubellimicrobium rubrum TaxID=2585369 RepID=UPI00268121C5
MDYDAIVIGGSYAGLSAALQLARARRRVLVIDAGERRNRFASSSHGFLGQDGCAPGVIVAESREQLLHYPAVTGDAGPALSAGRMEAGFTIGTGEGALTGDRVILAIGITDSLPDVPGLSERWGRSIFHCPYCHAPRPAPAGLWADDVLSQWHLRARHGATGRAGAVGRRPRAYPRCAHHRGAG